MSHRRVIRVPVETPGKLSAAVYYLPRDICCNCGATESVSVVYAALPEANLTGERLQGLPLPHCERCIPTANALPPRFGRSIQFFMPFFVLAALVIAGGGELVGWRFRDHPATMFLVITLCAIAAPLVLFRSCAPKFEGQTSRYQAVKLKPVRSFLGKVVALEFTFTNAEYARLYDEALKSEGWQLLNEGKG